MNAKIEQLLEEIAGLKAQKAQDLEEIRTRLLGKKGDITRLFEDFHCFTGTKT